MTNSLRPVLVPILFSLLTLPGCDESAPVDLDDAQLRSIIKVQYQTPAPLVFKGKILPPCDGPEDDGPWGGGYGVPDFGDVLRNAPAIFAAAQQDLSAAEEFCPTACRGVDLRWLGQVTAEGELRAADSEWMEGEKGDIYAEALITGELAMACLCE